MVVDCNWMFTHVEMPLLVLIIRYLVDEGDGKYVCYRHHKWKVIYMLLLFFLDLD